MSVDPSSPGAALLLFWFPAVSNSFGIGGQDFTAHWPRCFDSNENSQELPFSFKVADPGLCFDFFRGACSFQRAFQTRENHANARKTSL